MTLRSGEQVKVRRSDLERVERIANGSTGVVCRYRIRNRRWPTFVVKVSPFPYFTKNFI